MDTDKLSRMTLGTVQLGLDYGIANKEGKPDKEKAFSILEAAFNSGINCLDTAAAYGDSEKVIGKYLSSGKRKRSEICIVTKFKLGSISQPEAESAMMRSVEESLKNLRTDYLDILLMHDANEFSIYGNKITDGFEKLLAEGTIRMEGASCYKFGEIEPLIGNMVFKAFQVPVNLLDMRITRGEGAVRLREKIIFARSVFLQGLFFMDPATLKGNLREAGKYLVRIAEIARKMNISVEQLSAAYVNSLEFVDSLVIGADNPEQVYKNAGLPESGTIDYDLRSSIEDQLKGVPEWLFMPGLWDKQRD